MKMLLNFPQSFFGVCSLYVQQQDYFSTLRSKKLIF
jgi:hypothetical protein